MEITTDVLGFASELVPLVRDGTKILTYRLGNKWDFLQPGDIIEAKDSSTGEVFAKLEITSKEKSTFGELQENREGHEEYQNKEEKRQAFEKYYQRPVEDSEPVTIVGFKVVDLTH
jgi:hypothetical protein